MQEEIVELNDKLSQKENEILELVQAHNDQIRDLKTDHESASTALE